MDEKIDWGLEEQARIGTHGSGRWQVPYSLFWRKETLEWEELDSVMAPHAEPPRDIDM